MFLSYFSILFLWSITFCPNHFNVFICICLFLSTDCPVSFNASSGTTFARAACSTYTPIPNVSTAYMCILHTFHLTFPSCPLCSHTKSALKIQTPAKTFAWTQTNWRDSASRTDACANDEFRCHNGALCIPAYLRCDGTNQCADRSDELHCNDTTTDWDNDYESRRFLCVCFLLLVIN